MKCASWFLNIFLLLCWPPSNGRHANLPWESALQGNRYFADYPRLWIRIASRIRCITEQVTVYIGHISRRLSEQARGHYLDLPPSGTTKADTCCLSAAAWFQSLIKCKMRCSRQTEFCVFATAILFHRPYRSIPCFSCIVIIFMTKYNSGRVVSGACPAV